LRKIVSDGYQCLWLSREEWRCLDAVEMLGFCYWWQFSALFVGILGGSECGRVTVRSCSCIYYLLFESSQFLLDLSWTCLECDVLSCRLPLLKVDRWRSLGISVNYCIKCWGKEEASENDMNTRKFAE
jgi:hypothetical protein